MARIQIILPADLKKAFQIKAIQENKDMTEILIDSIKSYVGQNKKVRNVA